MLQGAGQATANHSTLDHNSMHAQQRAYDLAVSDCWFQGELL